METVTPQSLSDLTAWITATLDAHRERARSVASLCFPRLSAYFSPETLTKTHYVEVDELPIPPLTVLGLPQFAEFEGMTASAVTYLDTCFVQRNFAVKESLYFHELVHVTQWRLLGVDRFLTAYGQALLQGLGYHTNPFETMAYELQSDFDHGRTPFDAEAEVKLRLDAFAPIGVSPHWA